MSPNEPPMSPNEPPIRPPIYYQHATEYTPPIICILPIPQQDKNVFFIYQFLRYTKVIKKVNTQEG